MKKIILIFILLTAFILPYRINSATITIYSNNFESNDGSPDLTGSSNFL